MSICPHCQQRVDAQAVSCPHCGKILKAFGHPGIPLYQAKGETFLCDRCVYHEDDTCNFPQRPYAKTCTLFRDISEPIIEESARSVYYKSGGWQGFKIWCQKNRALLIVLGLVVVSVLIAL